MILTKEELLSALRGEVRLLLHLAGKVEPEMLQYRPGEKQRTLLELLQYLTIMGPIHTRACLREGPFNMDTWREAWTTGKAGAKGLDLEAAKSELGKQSGLYTELVGACTDEFLSAEIEMFGRKASRAALLIGLVVNHFAAYRMQLFLYLKACGRDELSTINLWAGVDKS